jgi:hypothetical protein
MFKLTKRAVAVNANMQRRDNVVVSEVVLGESFPAQFRSKFGAAVEYIGPVHRTEQESSLEPLENVSKGDA